jgi:putative redox protein
MRVVARRREGFAHDVEIDGGHTVVVDEPIEAGGTDAGPTPTRLVAAGLAACTAITMEMYAERKGWEIGRVEVEVDVEYAGAAPTSFAVTVHLPEGLSEEQQDRLLTIAGKCPVHKVIANPIPVAIADRVEPL